MYQVRLSDGSLYDVRWCGKSGGALTIAMDDGNMIELAQAFGDPEKTARVEFVYDNAVTVYDGYTELVALIDGRWQGMDITITLRQGE